MYANHQPSKFVSRAALAVFLPLVANMAHASIFDEVEQKRSVEISGDLRAFDLETQQYSTATFSDGAASSSDQWTPLRMGMDIGLAGPDCFGQGLAYQSLSVGDGTMHFIGNADVNMNGFSNYPYMVEGSGGALVNIEYAFTVAQAQIVDLSMDSTVGDFREDEFKFSFKSLSGNYIWGATGVLDGDGQITRKFVQRLVLQPGRYTVTAQLSANSSLSGSNGVAGRTWAEFSITAVPEPHTGLLCLAGLTGMATVIRRRKTI